MFELGTRVSERYELTEKLGEGAHGQVFVAVDHSLGQRRLVIKTLKGHLRRDDDEAQEFEARFRQEAIVAARINHPSIVAIYDFGLQDGVYWYAMEFIDGATSLRRAHREATRAKSMIPLPDVYAYLRDAAAGLRVIHDQGVIHRDIKLDNMLIFRTPEGPHLKLLDFGVAHLPQSHLTVDGQAMGTPEFQAPEALAALVGESTMIDHRVDLFALGVCAYELLTGERPFRRDSLPATFEAIRNFVPQPPSALRGGLETGWDQWVMRLLAKKPADRFADAAGAYQALEHLDSLPSFEPPSEPLTATQLDLTKLKATSQEEAAPVEELAQHHGDWSFQGDDAHKTMAAARGDDVSVDHTQRGSPLATQVIVASPARRWAAALGSIVLALILGGVGLWAFEPPTAIIEELPQQPASGGDEAAAPNTELPPLQAPTTSAHTKVTSVVETPQRPSKQRPARNPKMAAKKSTKPHTEDIFSVQHIKSPPRVERPPSSIVAGTIAQGVIANATPLGSSHRCEVRIVEDVRDELLRLLVPKNSRFVGQQNVARMQDGRRKMDVTFSTWILPDGSRRQVRARLVDEAGKAGWVAPAQMERVPRATRVQVQFL